jgi:hypothetical protein
VRSTTFLFTTLCTSIQLFGVTRVQTGTQEKQFGHVVPRRVGPRAPAPALLGAVRCLRPYFPRPRTSRGQHARRDAAGIRAARAERAAYRGVRASGLAAPARAARCRACPAHGCSPSVTPCSKSKSSSIKRLSPRFPRADRSAIAARQNCPPPRHGHRHS